MKRKWAKEWHKFLGVTLCVLLFLSALSGIILNHRTLWSEIDIPRVALPEAYQIRNWNNATLRNVLHTTDATYLYGYAGVWQTDSTMSQTPVPLNRGFMTGADERKVVAMAQDAQGKVWGASQFHLYTLDHQNTWQLISLPDTITERLTDLYVKGDSLLLLTRSHLLLRTSQNPAWQVVDIPPSEHHEWGTLLFQIVWALHSGEFFGTAGKIVVDILGVLLIAISLTGFYFFFLRHRNMRQASTDQRRRHSQRLQMVLRWHRKWGWRLLLPLLFVVVTGWALRPPLLLALVFNRVEPWEWSHLHSDNPWHDRFRAIRYDIFRQQWLLSTSTGFYTCKHLGDVPRLWRVQPPVSPMGITAFEQQQDGSWLIGSFSGLYEVHPERQRSVVNYFTGQAVDTSKRTRPVSDHAVSGILIRNNQRPLVALYDAGLVERTSAVPYYTSCQLVPQPPEVAETPFSLWQYALEIHTGRIFIPFIGKLGTELFTFVFGLLTIVVLLTGWWRMRRR